MNLVSKCANTYFKRLSNARNTIQKWIVRVFFRNKWSGFCDSENDEFFGYCVFSFVARVYFCSAYMMMRKKNVILSCSLLSETSAGIMCYINQVTHSVGYPRFVFTNNTPYGRPSNNNILVRFETFCSLGETHDSMRMVVWSASSTVFHACVGFLQTESIAILLV